MLGDELVKWFEEIGKGALYWIQSMPGKPWTNLQESVKYEAEFNAACANARADVLANFTPGGRRVARRAFGV